MQVLCKFWLFLLLRIARRCRVSSAMASGAVCSWNPDHVLDWVHESGSVSPFSCSRLLEQNVDGNQFLRYKSPTNLHTIGIRDPEQVRALLASAASLREIDGEGARFIALTRFKDEIRSTLGSNQATGGVAEPGERLDEAWMAAMQLQLEEVEQAQQGIQDSLVARRFERDVASAQFLQQQLERQRQQEEGDFELARRLAGQAEGAPPVRHHFPPPRAPQPDSTPPVRHHAESSGAATARDLKRKGVVVSGQEGEEGEGDIGVRGRLGGPALDMRPAPPKRIRKEKFVPLVECSVCTEEVEEVLETLCEHQYCHGCMRKLLLEASLDESLLPPRCCRIVLDLDAVMHVLTPDQAVAFQKRMREHSIVNKMYCPNKTCSEFLDLDAMATTPAPASSRLPCLKCSTHVCTACKSAWHEGFTCVEYQGLPDSCRNAEDVATLKLADQEQWQRCDRCGMFVALHLGCNHMTCRCGHEFCYICGVKWKKCECLTWTEAHLYGEAERRAVRREAQDAAAAGRPRRAAAALAVQVENIATQLRTDNECVHRFSFTRRLGVEFADQCSYCGYSLSRFGYACEEPDCREAVCKRCYMNRLRQPEPPIANP